MELLDLVTEIHRYCAAKGINTLRVTVSELTSEMIIECTEESN